MNLNIDIDRINAQLQRLVALVKQADTIISNSQSREEPFTRLGDSARIFCAVLASQGKRLAESTAKQYGITLTPTTGDVAADTVESFFEASAEHVDTTDWCMMEARLAAADALEESAGSLIAQAQDILDRKSTIGNALA